MENASKALLIAGGVLLAIIVLTIGIYLKGKFDNVADQYVASQDVAEIQKYNAKFEPYKYVADVTAQEIVSLIEFARTNGGITEVNLGGTNYTNKESYESSSFVKLNSNKLYLCEDIQYNDQGRVIYIYFE